ncbi:hypothetical protein LAV72_17210 [Lysinibacillus xylanilyticus]|uniref:hypothetical protein n=1 Tax=Lysinibacillus xylanilyticus TaxID=582475 RepID=UPI002B24EA78|nr:hypothetical protein [Lysinibacillus xylanilyticus]MEB2301359.1 hypothetical protein [Lysinibacillus xylanilyticus]
MGFLRESEAAATTGFVCAKAKRQQQHDVGHSGVFTGCEVFSLSSFISVDVWASTEK